jgi:hypothetical protein
MKYYAVDAFAEKVFEGNCCVGYLIHPLGFVWLTATLKSVMIPSRIPTHLTETEIQKKRPSKVVFLSSFAQKVTSCGPDGIRTREA